MTGDGLDHVYGLTPVLNALQARRRPSFDELKVQDRSNSEGGGGGGGSNVASRDMAAITRLAEEMGVPVDSTSAAATRNKGVVLIDRGAWRRRGCGPAEELAE